MLELSVGYEKIIKKLTCSCNSIFEIDISEDNIKLGNKY